MKQGTVNLYIDESGSGAIYEPPPQYYQFFNMAGVVLNEDQEKKLYKELTDWKKKNLQHKSANLHAVSLFENYAETSDTVYKYKQQFLINDKRFFRAIVELIAIFNSVSFKAAVFYIDLFELRRKLDFDKYVINKKQNILKDIINKEYRGAYLQPISTITHHFFKFHEYLIREGKAPGYICFESQREFDEWTVKTFHQLLNNHESSKYKPKYGKHILGLNFYTKASLCAALELADFIAYCSTQLLRFKVDSKELTMKKERFSILYEAYKGLKSVHKIVLRDVTHDCFLEYKNLYNPQKKASV